MVSCCFLSFLLDSFSAIFLLLGFTTSNKSLISQGIEVLTTSFFYFFKKDQLVFFGRWGKANLPYTVGVAVRCDRRRKWFTTSTLSPASFSKGLECEYQRAFRGFFTPSSIGLILPCLSHLWVFAWVAPQNRNTGRFWRSTAVIRLASPRGISPCRRVFQSSIRYRRDRSRIRCGRGQRASRLP